MDINITVKYEQNFTLKLSQWYVQCTMYIRLTFQKPTVLYQREFVNCHYFENKLNSKFLLGCFLN